MGCFGKALSRAAAVFEEELAARCPEADFATSDEDYGKLLENITSEVIIDTQGRGGRAKIGFGRKGMVALWVEFGHRMLSHSGKDLGEVKAHPFMRLAFESAADRAVAVFTETVKEFMDNANLSAYDMARAEVITIDIDAGTARFLVDMDKANVKLQQFGKRAHETVTSMQASSAAIRELAGGSNVRAIERLISMFPALANAAKATFLPVQECVRRDAGRSRKEGLRILSEDGA